MDIKKIYYYIISLFAAFVFFWGDVDLLSTLSSSLTANISVDREIAKNEEESVESFYQRQASRDRIFDSLARIVVAGGVFVYCRKKTEEEKGV